MCLLCGRSEWRVLSHRVPYRRTHTAHNLPGLVDHRDSLANTHCSGRMLGLQLHSAWKRSRATATAGVLWYLMYRYRGGQEQSMLSERRQPCFSTMVPLDRQLDRSAQTGSQEVFIEVQDSGWRLKASPSEATLQEFKVPAIMEWRAGCTASGPLRGRALIGPASQWPARSHSIVTLRRFALAFVTSRGRRQRRKCWLACRQLTGTSQAALGEGGRICGQRIAAAYFILPAAVENVSCLGVVDYSKQPQSRAC